jgi:23S rRNA pseudouridine1911/1915/1917 synthase
MPATIITPIPMTKALTATMCTPDAAQPLSESTYTLVVTDDKAGARLDRVLADALPALSRTRLKALIEVGGVTGAEGRPATDPAERVRAGQAFQVSLPLPPAANPEPEAIPLAVVYEDRHLIVIDKPPGLVVHPGAGTPRGTLVNALLAHCPGGLSTIGAPRRPGIVHRLDKDTSGLIVVARTDAAHRDLARQFAARSVDRAYWAVVWGHPRPSAARIESRIGRSERDRTRMAVVTHGGKVAVTRYEAMRSLGTAATLVECRLATGRTHQIRVHMAAVGHPVVGDRVYGTGGPAAARTTVAALPFARQALHAFLIGFDHPETGDRISFSSDLPADINRLMETLERI